MSLLSSSNVYLLAHQENLKRMSPKTSRQSDYQNVFSVENCTSSKITILLKTRKTSRMF